MTEETTATEEQQEAPVYGNVSVEELEKPEYDQAQFDEFMALYEESISGIKEGQIVKGTVVSIGPSEVMVDIGFKSEGAVPIKEFSDSESIEKGQEIEVFLENVEDQEGQVVLSKQKADFMRVWDLIKDAHDTGNTVEGRLMRRIKGGIVVNLFGVDAFLPGSQIDIRQVKNFDQFIGHQFPFKIIKLNKARRNIVVSRRAVLEEERARMREEIVKVLEEGQIREGVVKNITDFGALYRLGRCRWPPSHHRHVLGARQSPLGVGLYRRPHQGQGAQLRSQARAHLLGTETTNPPSVGEHREEVSD